MVFQVLRKLVIQKNLLWDLFGQAVAGMKKKVR